MKNVEIKVNTLNRLKKIRQGVVYDSITTVIDELLQNCQRTFLVSGQTAGEETIDVVIKDDYIVIRDNGGGCDNPADIFEFEKSGWHMNAIDDAFGQGGSESVFEIADYFEIRSNHWKVVVDVLNILETGDLDLPVQDSDYLGGYEIMLKGEKIATNLYILEDFIQNTLKHYPYNCYVNGQRVEYEELQQVDSIHTCKFDNNFYSATLGIQRGYRDAEIYYEKRKVTDKWLPGVVGIIELKRDAVNLKVPDRKSIIYDDKLRAFNNQLDEDIKYLYLEFVSKATPEQFDEYVDQIDEHLEAVDYVEFLPFYEENLDARKLKQLSQEVATDGTIQDKETLNNFAKVVEEKTAQDIVESVSVTPGYTIPGKVVVNEKKIPRYKKFKDEVKTYINTVWLENGKQQEYVDIIEKVKSYGVKVVISKNKLYNKAFEFLHIPHIDEIAKRSESKYILGSVIGGHHTPGLHLQAPELTITQKEDRVLYVLSLIEQRYGLSDVFRIADVKEHILIESGDKIMVDAIAKVTAAPVKEKGKIYLDRKSLQLGKIDLTSSRAKVTKFDVLVIMLNMNTIASGLAKLLYNTIDGTVEHYNKTEKISKEIALFLASL